VIFVMLPDPPSRQSASRYPYPPRSVRRPSYNSVARELGLNWRTVRRYATATSWQDCVRRRPRIPSPLDRYLEYLQQRWGDGEHNAKVLHEEIKAKGYLGHYQRVKIAVAPLRRGLPINQPHQRRLSPREVARWITTSPPNRTLDTVERPQRLLTHCPELDQAHTWSAPSPPCSTPPIPNPYRSGSTNSRPAAYPDCPASPKSSARTYRP
jgi:hypothetical protein